MQRICDFSHITPLPTIETTNIPSLILDFASVFRFNDRVVALEKDVAELLNDPLHTQVTVLVDYHLDTRMGATREEFMNFLSTSLTDRITKQVRTQLPQILPEEMSNFAPPMIEKMIQDRDDKDKDEGPSARSDRGLKKQKTSKDAEPTTSPKNKDSSSRSSKGTKSQPKSFGKSVHAGEPEFEVGDTDTPQGQKGTQEKLGWENPEGGDYPFDLSKRLPLITRGNHQSVPVEFFINNDLKDQRKSFYAYARGKQSRGDVDSTKRILAVTHVSVMRKHGYGYLEEIVVRKADNALYKLKEGDFPRLRINDIKDMLLLVVQNWLIDLLGDDVADFAIALRMFAKSLVIQKRVEDLQLGVESYQKQINVTKPNTTRPDLRKRHPYTPYKNPQGFIYFDEYQRNRLMRSDKLYKFSDGPLTRLLSSLEDITKNIDIEYLPKRRWSTLEKKKDHCMIKDINKLFKEMRMKRSLEKFVGGRLYGTDLRLLKQTI
nr:hypothetical protein [Tanacetum cinerariifolium]